MEFIVKTLVNVLHKFIWNVTIINLCFHTWKLFGKMRNDRRAIDAMSNPSRFKRLGIFW